MTRLDENRAKSQLAQRAGAAVAEVRQLAIWGNHSSTMYPDFENASIGGESAELVIADRQWLENDFLTTVQERGAAIIQARGKSSAASAANAALDTVRSLIAPTAPDEWFSAGIASEGNPYGIGDGLIYSFPLRADEREMSRSSRAWSLATTREPRYPRLKRIIDRTRSHPRSALVHGPFPAALG